MLDQVLYRALDPNIGVTPSQFNDLMEMFLTLMLLRRVCPEFWVEHCGLVMKALALSHGVMAEARLLQIEGISEETKKTLAGALELSGQELCEIRSKLLAPLALLREMPMPHVKLN